MFFSGESAIEKTDLIALLLFSVLCFGGWLTARSEGLQLKANGDISVNKLYLPKADVKSLCEAEDRVLFVDQYLAIRAVVILSTYQNPALIQDWIARHYRGFPRIQADSVRSYFNRLANKSRRSELRRNIVVPLKYGFPLGDRFNTVLPFWPWLPIAWIGIAWLSSDLFVMPERTVGQLAYLFIFIVFVGIAPPVMIWFRAHAHGLQLSLYGDLRVGVEDWRFDARPLRKVEVAGLCEQTDGSVVVVDKRLVARAIIHPEVYHDPELMQDWLAHHYAQVPPIKSDLIQAWPSTHQTVPQWNSRYSSRYLFNKEETGTEDMSIGSTPFRVVAIILLSVLAVLFWYLLP